MNAPVSSKSTLYLVRSTIALLLVTGAGLLLWMVHQANQYPEAQARQFGRFGEAVPFWAPVIGFTIIAVVAMVYLFWQAARRVAAGEDLFGSRFRRRPGSSPDSQE
jgi:hypothetical protein